MKRIDLTLLAWLVLIVLCLAVISDCHAQNTPAEASFRVENGPIGGSATGIAPHLAVTNAHVAISLQHKPLLIHGLTKKQWRAMVISIDTDADLALLYTSDGELPWVKVNPAGMASSEEATGYGYGSSRILRTGTGRVVGVRGVRSGGVPVWRTEVDSEPGDSGSGVFNAAGELIGITWGSTLREGETVTAAARRGEDVYNAVTSADRLIALGRDYDAKYGEGICADFCGGGHCDQGGGRPQGGSGGQRPGQMIPVRPPVASEEKPPAMMPPSAAAPPAATPPAAPPMTPPAIAQPDAGKLADAILEKLAKDPRFMGPPGMDGAKGERGEKGEPGIDGLPGREPIVDYERIVDEVLDRMGPAQLSVSAMSETDVEILVNRIKSKIEGRINYEFIPAK